MREVISSYSEWIRLNEIKSKRNGIESNKPQYLIHENRLISNLISQENRIEYNIGSLRIELDTVELNRLESHAVYNQIQYKY